MCATEYSARCHARRDGRAMWLACNRARFPATRPRVFCELKIMKIVILIYQILQEKFAYGELFMLVMIGYIFMFKMVTTNTKFRFRNFSWVNTSVNQKTIIILSVFEKKLRHSNTCSQVKSWLNNCKTRSVSTKTYRSLNDKSKLMLI